VAAFQARRLQARGPFAIETFLCEERADLSAVRPTRSSHRHSFARSAGEDGWGSRPEHSSARSAQGGEELGRGQARFWLGSFLSKEHGDCDAGVDGRRRRQARNPVRRGPRLDD
jgi:hypothetical protein